MPQVRAYEPDQVKLRGIGVTPLRGPSDPAAFGADVGRATQGAANALGHTADLTEHILDTQAETRAREVDVTLSSHIRDELSGENGLLNKQGQAFVDSAPEYIKRIEDKGKELSASAKNAFERQLVDRVVSQRLEAARNQIGGQVVRETQFANKAAASARASNQTTNAAMAYRDPKAYQRERATLDAAIYDDLQAKGTTDPASFQAAKRERYNSINAYAIQDMMRRGEVGPAQAWLDDAMVKGELDPATAEQLQEHLDKTTTENEIGYLAEGRAPPTEVDGRMPKATPELVAAVKWQESRGNGEAVSPKGAAGVMQVMPETGPEAARLAKVAWQPERLKSKKPEDIEYQQKLGEAYLNAQLKRFGGSVVAALAAYNAGPEIVQDWIDGTNKTGKNKGGLKLGDPTVNPREWAAKVPFAETRDYIGKITTKLGGSAKTPLDPNVRTADAVEAWAQQFPDPKDRERARAAGFAKVNANRAAENQRQSDAWDQAQPYIQKDQPWTAIPKTIWNNLSPQNQTSLIEAQKRGTNRVTSPEALDAIYSLIEQRPGDFKTMDLLKLAPDFSPSDFEQLRKLQHDAVTGQGEWKRTPAQYTAVTRLAPMVAPPRMMLPANKQELKTFQARWFEAVQLKQNAQKDPLTDDEIAEIGTRMLAETAAGSGMFGANTMPLYKFGVDTNKNKAEGRQFIPPAEASQVAQFLQRRNGKPPTAGQVLEAWRSLKAAGEL